MTLFHFSNYCTLHKNNFVYINYCYTDKIYYLPFRKRLSNYFVAVVIKHTGHLEMNFGFTLTKRQRFICIWLSKLNASQPVCHTCFWEKTILDFLPLETDAPPKRHLSLCDRRYMQSMFLYQIKFFLALYSVIYIVDTFIIQIQNLENTYMPLRNYDTAPGGTEHPFL